MRIAVTSLLLAGLASGSALAAGGVLEINQTCATTTGCFPGDAPGFPVTIASPGSYVLTSNLTVTATGTDGIAWPSVGHVSLDLGGFTVAGPTTCTGAGTTLVCSPTNAGIGILAGFDARVFGGQIHGFQRGLALNIGVARDLTVFQNSSDGVLAAFGTVENVVASLNGGSGIELSNSTATSCVSWGNKGPGFSAARSHVSKSTAHQNGAFGINASESVTNENVVTLNAGGGIAYSHGVIQGNAVTSNSGDGLVGLGGLVAGNLSRSNTLAGISEVGHGVVRGNVARQNTGVGLYLAPTSGTATPYQDNVVELNAGGTVTSGVNMGGNSCDGRTTCP